MARVFNGSSDLIKATGGSAWTGPSNAASYSMWILGAAQATKAFYTDGRNTTTGFIFFGTQTVSPNNKFRAVISANGGATLLDNTTTAVILDSTWHHVAFTITAAGAYVMYVDGVSDQTGSVVSDTDPVDLWAGIGCLARNTNSAFFAGDLAEVANWTRTLSTTEVAALAGGAHASLFAPSHYWPLLGVASPEPDFGTTSEADGTLTGTTSVAGPVQVDYSTFISSLGRRPVPMVKGPDKDHILGMKGNSF